MECLIDNIYMVFHPPSGVSHCYALAKDLRTKYNVRLCYIVVTARAAQFWRGRIARRMRMGGKEEAPDGNIYMDFLPASDIWVGRTDAARRNKHTERNRSVTLAACSFCPQSDQGVFLESMYSKVAPLSRSQRARRARGECAQAHNRAVTFRCIAGAKLRRVRRHTRGRDAPGGARQGRIERNRSVTLEAMNPHNTRTTQVEEQRMRGLLRVDGHEGMRPLNQSARRRRARGEGWPGYTTVIVASATRA